MLTIDQLEVITKRYNNFTLIPRVKALERLMIGNVFVGEKPWGKIVGKICTLHLKHLRCNCKRPTKARVGPTSDKKCRPACGLLDVLEEATDHMTKIINRCL